jgi:hypothetical protein
MTTSGLRRRPCVSTAAAARPMDMASSAVISSFATPRTPSVPNSLAMIQYPLIKQNKSII